MRFAIANNTKVRFQPGIGDHACRVATYQHGSASLKNMMVVQCVEGRRIYNSGLGREETGLQQHSRVRAV